MDELLPISLDWFSGFQKSEVFYEVKVGQFWFSFYVFGYFVIRRSREFYGYPYWTHLVTSDFQPLILQRPRLGEPTEVAATSYFGYNLTVLTWYQGWVWKFGFFRPTLLYGSWLCHLQKIGLPILKYVRQKTLAESSTTPIEDQQDYFFFGFVKVVIKLRRQNKSCWLMIVFFAFSSYYRTIFSPYSALLILKLASSSSANFRFEEELSTLAQLRILWLPHFV